MGQGKLRKTIGIILSVFTLLVASSNSFRLAFSIPDSVVVEKGQGFVIDVGLPVVWIYSSCVSDQGRPGTLSQRVSFDTGQPGEYILEFRLFGLVPLRRVSLVVTDPIMVVPGGHSIGVILRSAGVVVTGLVPVATIDGREVWPARNAGLKPGDVIISVQGKKVTTKEDLAFAVEQAGRDGTWVELVIEKADGSTVKRALWPVRNRNGNYNIGVAVKDSLAGVGTLTFYDPQTGVYAALGHVISEGDSRRPVTMKMGHIVRATVTGVQPSRRGHPGEVIGTFVDGQDVIGSILKNGPCGITGLLNVNLQNPYYPEPIPLGTESRVRKGPAEILTTINGNTIERFSIEIEQVFRGTGVSSKGFLVRITDPRLLSATGGIVQGMSGSPVIQDGYLVGAITHVLVNDPARGYGTFAEWMAREASLSPENADMRTRAAFFESACYVEQ